MLREFKNRIRLEKVIQGLLYAVSAGLLSAGIAICAFLLAEKTAWYFYLIGGAIGLVVLLVVFLIYFLTHRTTDKEAAKRIDSTFGLKEKASTMVAFEGKESLLINKQREDAKRNIQGKNPRKLGVKLTLLSLPLPLIGIGSFTTSFFTTDIVNAFKVTDVKEDNFDDETDEIIDKIKDYIGKSQASAAFKEKLYEILEQLRADLKGDTSIPSRQAKVDAAKEEVDIALDEVNTKEEIGSAMTEEESDFTVCGQAVQNADVEAMKAALEEIANSVDDLVSPSGIIEQFDEWIAALEAVLAKAEEEGVSPSDANYKTFSDLLAKLKEIRDNVENKIGASQNVSQEMLVKLIRDSREQAKKAFEEAISNLTTDLNLERANDQLAEEVKKLMDQLVDPRTDSSDMEGEGEGGDNSQEGEEGDVGDEGNEETEDGNGEEGGAEGGEGNSQDGNKGDGNGSGSGGQEGEGNGQGQGSGAGSGGAETEYGSNDKVYTGENGQTEYGDVIGDYQNDASDDAKETGDDDLEGAIGDYFDELYGDKGGSKDDGK